jgi:hypothetical protein
MWDIAIKADHSSETVLGDFQQRAGPSSSGNPRAFFVKMTARKPADVPRDDFGNHIPQPP